MRWADECSLVQQDCIACRVISTPKLSAANLQVRDRPNAAPEAEDQHPRLLHAVHHRRHRRRPRREAEDNDVGLHLIDVDHNAGQPCDACAQTSHASHFETPEGTEEHRAVKGGRTTHHVLQCWGCVQVQTCTGSNRDRACYRCAIYSFF